MLFSNKNVYRDKSENTQSVDMPKSTVIGVLIRVSSEMQAVEGDSIEMQQELAQQHAESIGGVIHKFYIEDGLSASKVRMENRNKLQELMQDIENGIVNYVISYKRDRLFRNTIEHMQFLQFLVENDCDIYFTARGELQTDLSTFKASGVTKMMESLLSMMAEMESAQTSSRVSDTMISKASRGEFTGGRLPIGYKREGDKFVPIQEGIPTIELIERLYLNGYGIKTIARYLNGGEVKGLEQLDVPIPKPSEYAKTETWSQRTVQTVLMNPFYTGHISYNSKKNADIDRIIEKSELIIPVRTLETQEKIFEMYQKKTVQNKPKRMYSTPFLLTGILYCGECGQPIRVQTSQRKNGDKYSYYKCGYRYTDKKECCSMNRIYRKEVLEKLVLECANEKIKELLDSDVYELYKKKIDEDKDISHKQADTIQDKIKTLDLKLKNLINMVVELDSNDDLKNIYLNEQRKVLNEISQLKESHAELVKKIQEENEDEHEFQNFLELARTFRDNISNVSIGIQKQLLERMFESIHITKEGDVLMKYNFGENKYNGGMRYLEGSKVPSFISLETIRDAKDSININDEPSDKLIHIKVLNDFVYSFNYFDTISKIFNLIKEEYLNYLITLDEKLDVQKAHLITDTDIESHTLFNEVELKLKGRWNCYIEIRLGISRSSRMRLERGIVPTLKRMREQLQRFNKTINDFIYFISSKHNFVKLDESMLIELEHVLSNRNTSEKPLFKDLIKCNKCGKLYTGRMWTNQKYVCKNNHWGNGIENKCNSVILDERYLIAEFERTTNIPATVNAVKNTIAWIEILEDDTIKFHFKKRRNK